MHARRRSWKRRRLWTRSLEERLGVGGAECGDSRQWNTGGLLPSVAHLHGNRWEKARAEVWWDAAGEVGGGHRTADRRDHTTRQEGRTSPSTKPSEGVSDEACPHGPPTSTTPITTTPAQARPGGQTEPEPSVPCALRPHLPARCAVAGLARRTSEWGERGRRWPQRGRGGASRRRSLSAVVRARPAGRELQTAAGAAGRHPQARRTAKTPGSADRAGSGRPAGVQDRDRAHLRSQLPRRLVWLSTQAPCGPSGQSGQRGHGVRWVCGRCRPRARLWTRSITTG